MLFYGFYFAVFIQFQQVQADLPIEAVFALMVCAGASEAVIGDIILILSRLLKDAVVEGSRNIPGGKHAELRAASPFKAVGGEIDIVGISRLQHVRVGIKAGKQRVGVGKLVHELSSDRVILKDTFPQKTIPRSAARAFRRLSPCARESGVCAGTGIVRDILARGSCFVNGCGRSFALFMLEENLKIFLDKPVDR